MAGFKLQLFTMQTAPQIYRLNDSAHTSFVGQRLDVFLAAVLQRSRSHGQTLLKAGAIQLEPHPERAEASYRLRAGDIVTISSKPAETMAPPLRDDADIPLEIVYEDEHLLAINKQPGLVVHPAAGHRTGTLIDALLHRGTQLADRGEQERPGLVHRLDKDTSGLVLIAKTNVVHERLAQAFAEREVSKTYRALCWGTFRQLSGGCREAIGRHRVHRQKMTVLKSGGRAAHTDYRVQEQGRLGADVECVLHTGRTHQIRVHLAHLGHPIWGDHVYGRAHATADAFEPSRQMLHAWRLEISHPVTGEKLTLEAPLPDDFLASREKLLSR